MYEFMDEYVTGIESIDAEHKRLFEIADETYRLSKEEFLVDKYDQVRHILGELKDYAEKYCAEVTACRTHSEALALAMSYNENVFIFGSLYLASSIRPLLLELK